MQLSWKSSKSESLSFCTSSLSAFRASKNCSQMVARPVDVRASFKRLRPWQQPKAPKRWNELKWWQKVWASNIGQHPAEKIGGNAPVPRNKGGSPEHEGWRSYNQKDSRMTIRCFVFSKIILYAQQSLSPSFHRFLKPLQRMFFWRKKMYSLPPPSATPPTHLLWKAFGVLNLNFNEQLTNSTQNNWFNTHSTIRICLTMPTMNPFLLTWRCVSQP